MSRVVIQYQYGFSKVIILSILKIKINIVILPPRTASRPREQPCLSAFWAKITALCAVFSSDLTSMSKTEHWLLVFMALGANLKISIFDPPTVGGTYNLNLMYYNMIT